MAKSWNKLKLTESEDSIVELETPSPELAHSKKKPCLVGRWLSHKPLKLRAMSVSFLSDWNPVKGFQLKSLRKGALFLCEFQSHKDKETVLSQGPWQFQGQLVVFQHVHGYEQPSELKLDRCDFWVRVCDLPLNRIDENSIRKVAMKIGDVIEIDEEVAMSWCSYVRVRVRVDIEKPLVRGAKIPNERGEIIWVEFRYDNLPDFCNFCGFLDHVKDDCGDLPEDYEEDDWPYGNCLRASSPANIKCKTIGDKTSSAEKMLIEAYEDVLAVALATDYSFPQAETVKSSLEHRAKFAEEEIEKDEPDYESDDCFGFTLVRLFE